MIKLTVRPSEGPEKVFIVQKQLAIVGRGSGCDIILTEEGISREHVKIEASRTGVCYITDLGSTNGVMVDNKRIKPNTPVPFAPFHNLSIGSIPSIAVETGISAKKTLAAYRNILRKEDKTVEVELDIPGPKIRTQNAPNSAKLIKNQEEEGTEKSTSKRSMTSVLILAVLLTAITYFFFMK